MNVIIKKKLGYVFIVLFFIVSFLLTLFGIADRYLFFTNIIQFVFIVGIVVAFMNEMHLERADFITVFSSMGFRFAYALYSYSGCDLANPVLADDAGGFWSVASQYFENNFATKYTFFPYILNLEFHIFGKNVLSCIFINILLVTLMTLLVIEMLNKYHVSGDLRIISVFISAFFPYSMIISNSLWRESIYFFFLTASFCKYTDYIKSEKYLDLFLALALTIPVLLLHIGYCPLIIAYVLDILLREKSKLGAINMKKIVIIFVFIVFAIGAMSLDSVSLYFSKTRIDGLISRLSGAAVSSANLAGSTYLGGYQVTSFGSLVLFIILKLVFFLTSPLPMNWRNITDIISFLLDSCVHFYLLVSSIICVAKQSKANKYSNTVRIVKVGISSVLLCALVFCLGTSTAGTAMRHRSAMIGIEIIICAICKNSLREPHDISSNDYCRMGDIAEK